MVMKKTKDGYYESKVKQPPAAQQRKAVSTIAGKVRQESPLGRFLQLSKTAK